MAIPLNDYATRAFSEHPVAIWNLDDDAYYVSLMTNTQRLFSNWTKTGCTADDTPTLPLVDSPFDSDIYSSFYANSVPVSDTSITLTSPSLFQLDSLNQELGTFCINLYLYQDSLFVNWYEIGYKYYDTFLGAEKEVVKKIEAPSIKQWINFNFTFTIPQDDSNTVEMIIRANIKTGGSTTADYNFIVNGMSVGQWSEVTCSKSLGRQTVSLPVSCGLSPLTGISADQYGVLSDNGYYIVEDNVLLAQNEGLPIIFGTDSVTKIIASQSGNPSFIFPGKGMLNADGRYKNYSLEMWMKIKPNTLESRRILGPLSNDYGVYVREGFISLVLGDEIGSYSVSQWYRPMLMQLVFNQITASLIINGEEVITINYDRKNIDLPTDTDWWGVYSYSDIEIFEIDCISIFPYIMPTQVAKKHFVWGQGVESLQFINNEFMGTAAAIDFSNANYTSNVVYPDTFRWDAGYFNNINAGTTSVSLPNYSLPVINIGGRKLSDWYSANKEVNLLEYPAEDHPKFFTFRPNIDDGAWVTSGTNWNETSYLNFPTLNILTDPLSAIYGVFEINEEINETRPLIHFVNAITGTRLEINVNGLHVEYSFDGNVFYTDPISIDSHFVVGLNFEWVSTEFGYELLAFFGSPSSIEMYVGGDGITTFEGKIYRIGFCNQINFNEVSSHFRFNGITNVGDNGLFEEHFASYTLVAMKRYNRFFLDISVSSQWEEYYPLSRFASYIRNKNNTSYYDLDFMQINFGYPSMIDYIEEIIENLGWTYSELFNAYNNPVAKSYEILDDQFITGYTNYNDLKNNNQVDIVLDMSKSSIQADLTFQLLQEGANEPLSSFPYTKSLTDSLVIDAQAENTNESPYKAYSTKFEFTDNVVIYPPKNININDVAMVIHFTINQDGILSAPLNIRDMEITSRSLNENTFNQFGTKFGVPLYPYVLDGFYYNNKEKNPMLIYKGNTPYLYMTETSGVKVLTKGSGQKQYGFSMPVNSNRKSKFSVGAMQLWMMYDLPNFPETNMPIFEIDSLNQQIEFCIYPDYSAQRGVIFARDKISKQEIYNISYYQNGIYVKNPIVKLNEWNSIGFSFNEGLSFDNYPGLINMLGGITFNNISYYMVDGLGKSESLVARPWLNVLSDLDISPTDLTWQYWYADNPEGTQWKNVYILSQESAYTISPKEIYSKYVGTNRQVIDDDTGIEVSANAFSIFSDALWSSYAEKPV
jgi:hypothetical protein